MNNNFDFECNVRSYEEKLFDAEQFLTDVYIDINNVIDDSNITSTRNFRNEKYKYGNKTIMILAIHGKTLNVYLPLNPEKFKGTILKFDDVSNMKTYKDFPMRIKISNKTQLKETLKLIKLVKLKAKG